MDSSKGTVQKEELPTSSPLSSSTKAASLLQTKLGPRVHWSRAGAQPANPPTKVTLEPVKLQRESSLRRVSSLPLHFDQKPIKDLEVAKTIIEDAIGTAFDSNNHSIDLSNAGLTVVPSSIFDLKCFTPVNAQRTFCLLHIFLNNNFLVELPAELFELEKIGLLALRSNQLEEVPSDIYKLQSLEELSVAGNRLRWLPAELLSLPRLKSVSINQNPFLSDEEIELFNRDSTINALDLKEICIRILAIHAPQYLKSRGIQLSRCTHCHKQMRTHYSAFVCKKSVCDSKPVPVIYKSCSPECHKCLTSAQ